MTQQAVGLAYNFGESVLITKDFTEAFCFSNSFSSINAIAIAIWVHVAILLKGLPLSILVDVIWDLSLIPAIPIYLISIYMHSYHVVRLYGHVLKFKKINILKVLIPDSRTTLISLVIPRAIDMIWNHSRPLGFFWLFHFSISQLDSFS